MAKVPLVAPRVWFPNAEGTAGNALGLVYFYEAGTASTPKDTYTDAAGGTPNANPVVLDAKGTAAIWGSGAYKVVSKASVDGVTPGATISTDDNYTAFATAGSATTFADDVFAVQDNSDATKQFMLQLSGLTTGTTVVMTPPTANYTAAATNIAQTFTGAQRCSITSLTSASNSISVDFSLNNDFSHTFTENTTLANPSNIVAGQKGTIFLTQHASSPKTLAYGTYYKFIGGTPTVTNSNGALDSLSYQVRSATQIECVLNKGWA